MISASVSCLNTHYSDVIWASWRHGASTRLQIEKLFHYSGVIMGVMASQITSRTVVYSTVYAGADQRKHQSSASLAFVRGIHRWPMNSPNKGPVTRKMFHLMTSSCNNLFSVTTNWKRTPKPVLLALCEFNTAHFNGLVALTHRGRNKTIYQNGFSWMKMHEQRLKFHCIFLLGVQWYSSIGSDNGLAPSRRLGAVQATSHYLNQWWLLNWSIYSSLGLNELSDRASAETDKVCVFYMCIGPGLQVNADHFAAGSLPSWYDYGNINWKHNQHNT